MHISEILILYIFAAYDLALHRIVVAFYRLKRRKEWHFVRNMRYTQSWQFEHFWFWDYPIQTLCYILDHIINAFWPWWFRIARVETHRG